MTNTAQTYIDRSVGYMAGVKRDASAWLEAKYAMIADGFPAKTPANGEPGGRGIGGHGDPTFAASQQRQHEREELAEFEALAMENAGTAKRMAEIMSRNPVHYQHAKTMKANRCSGKIDPTCENPKVEHRDANGSVISSSLCLECFDAACPDCRERPPLARRGGLCEACERRRQRRAQAA